MSNRWPAIALVLFAAGAAQGTLKPIEQAYELGIGEVTLPGNDSGSLVVRPCAECRPVTLRVSPATTYVVRPGNAALTRSDFTAEVSRVRSRADALLFVYYDPGTSNVRRIVLQAGR